jgi:hypothetical protein
MSAEDARSQIIGVVIYLNGHKPIHIHLGDVCIFDNERKAYRPKDGFDYVSFAVPEISVVLNGHYFFGSGFFGFWVLKKKKEFPRTLCYKVF